MKTAIANGKYFAIVVLLLLVACKKESLLPDEIRPPRPMIKTITTTDPQGVIKSESFYYDSLWRIVAHTVNVNSTSDTNIVSYDSLNRWITSNGVQYPLNSQGLVSNDGFSASYTYNSNNNLVSINAEYGGSTYTYNNAGNMTASETYNIFHNGIYTFESDFIYNSSINTIGNQNKGSDYWGQSSENLLEREDWLANTNFTSRGFTLFNYAFNDSGWVSSMEQNRATLITDTAGIVYDTTYQLYRYNYTYY